MGKLINLIGKRFGKLTVINRAIKQYNNDGHVCWVCKCDCGNIVTVSGSSLRRKFTSSCGCLAKEKRKEATTKHGLAKSRLDNIYCKIKSRCLNPKEPSYKWYGARGITICDEWLQDKNKFFQWAINNGYKNNLTIDRIDNNGNYEPNNCKWSSPKEQARNRRTNNVIEFQGEKHTITEWCEILGYKSSVIIARFKRGWSVEKTFTTPLMLNQFVYKKP
jgi:hypothetical protein